MHFQFASNAERKIFRRGVQEEFAQRKMEKETDYFWSLVERNCRHRNRPPSLPREREESMLFGSQGTVGIKFDSYESIPVEKSGPGADEISPISSFEELNESLPDFLVSNIHRMKYDVPTPIQKYAIPLALHNRDLMCSAQTGSGKTCAFLLPMISSLHAMLPDIPAPNASPRYEMSIDNEGVHPLAVVLAPTRELAAQIHLESRKLSFGSQLRSLVLYGGSEIKNQLSDLSFGCDIIVATPGRLIDIVDRGIISLSQVKCLILDEADRMLDMGFEPQIREIVLLRDMPPKGSRQTLMFSATFKEDIQKLAAEFLAEYVWVGVGRVGSTVENITQRVVLASSDPSVKLRLTLDAIQATPGRTLVFVQKKRTASWLCETLRYQCRVRVDDIHSDKNQQQREASLRRFRDGQVRVLVGTDVAARGLDIADVAHVIQFDLPLSPDEFDTYIHRMGRTGRAGHQGLATSLFVPGRETGEGNGRVAHRILNLLEENDQEIPDWFREMATMESHRRGGFRSKQGGNKFGGRDIRNTDHGGRKFSSGRTSHSFSASGTSNGHGKGSNGGYNPSCQQYVPVPPTHHSNGGPGYGYFPQSFHHQVAVGRAGNNVNAASWEPSQHMSGLMMTGGNGYQHPSYGPPMTSRYGGDNPSHRPVQVMGTPMTVAATSSGSYLVPPFQGHSGVVPPSHHLSPTSGCPPQVPVAMGLSMINASQGAYAPATSSLVNYSAMQQQSQYPQAPFTYPTSGPSNGRSKPLPSSPRPPQLHSQSVRGSSCSADIDGCAEADGDNS